MGSTLLSAVTASAPAHAAPEETAPRPLAPAWKRGVKQSISINLGKNQVRSIPQIGYSKCYYESDKPMDNLGKLYSSSDLVRVLHGKHAGKRVNIFSLTSKMAYIRLDGEEKLVRVMQSSLEGENYWPTMPPIPPRRSLRIANQS